MKVKDPLALGMHQVMRYWKFLLASGARDDIEQIIMMTAWQYPPEVDKKSFSLALNRGLYKLARDLGWHKRHVKEGPDEHGHWWSMFTVPQDLASFLLHGEF